MHRHHLNAFTVAVSLLLAGSVACDDTPAETNGGSEEANAEESGDSDDEDDDMKDASDGDDDDDDDDDDGKSEDDTSGGEESDDESEGTGDLDNQGSCGLQGGSSNAVSGAFDEGTETYFLIADKGDGDTLCEVEFKLTHVGEPTVPCDMCEWVSTLEYSEGTIVTNVDGACENSELKYDMEKIMSMNGSRVHYGYIEELAGHNHNVMMLDEDMEAWKIRSQNVTYDGKVLTYSEKLGFCKY